MFLHFRRRKPEVQDISYNPESAMLKAYTTAKRAEVGILYLGMRLRNYYLEKTLAGPTPAFPGTIYYFEREESYTIENGWVNLKIKPFYGGFLSKNYEGICYLRCVRLGKSGLFPGQVHVAPLCCLEMEVRPEKEYVAGEGVELTLEGGRELKGKVSCNRSVKVKICRMNEYMHLSFPELLLSAEAGQHEFSWKPLAVEKGVVVFGDITGKEIVKTFGMTGNPYLLSDVTHASNKVLLEVEWGKLRKKKIAVPVNVGCRIF